MTKPDRPLAAALWMTGTVLCFSAMAVAGREIGAVHDTFELMTWRSVVGLVIVLAAAALTGQLRSISFDRIGSHAVRNIFHFTAQNLWFWSLTAIPLAQVFALEFTAPIWVVLLAPLFLGERLTRAKLLAAALGFAGVMIVAQPDFGALEPGVMAAAGSAVFFAVSFIMTKTLTRGEATLSILLWLSVMQLLFGLLTAGYDGVIQLPTAQTLPLIVIVAATGLAGHFCLTTALSLAPASIVTPLDFARLPAIALVGWLFYGEILDPWIAAGAILILGANWINIRAGLAAGKVSA